MIKCCKDCGDRCIGCHGRCERYRKEKVQDAEQKEKQRQRQFKEHLGYSFRANAHRKKKPNKYSEV